MIGTYRITDEVKIDLNTISIPKRASEKGSEYNVHPLNGLECFSIAGDDSTL